MFSITELAKQAKAATIQLASLTALEKQTTLNDMAALLRQKQQPIILENNKDLQAAREVGLSESMVDRLMLNSERVEAIAKAIEAIAAQDDPVGKISLSQTLDNGLLVQKMNIPLGVIAMIYESRPNVTADAAALCFKAGNAVILKGGKEALNSNIAIGNVLKMALEKNNIHKGAICIVSDPNRKHMDQLLALNDLVDLIIPRGGESLIRYVSENSRIPVIQHFKGVCHLYIDKDVDIVKATDILINGKTQRPSVCNALETLLIHEEIDRESLHIIVNALKLKNVKVHACKNLQGYFSDASLATDADYDTEYLALEIAVKQVTDLGDAVAHIHKYSSNHTEVIVTEDEVAAQAFINAINSSVVMVNASSRFSDGGELGLGAEIGISTSKLHAYGPMGADSLTTQKFVVVGSGQIRK